MLKDFPNAPLGGALVVDLDTGQYYQLDLPTSPDKVYSFAHNVSLSPDNSRLAYSITYSENKELISEIWIMKVSSEDKQLIRKVKGVINTLSWTPVGEQLVYFYQPPDRNAASDPSELWRLNTDGSGERLLAHNTRMAGERRYRPAWSPDGRHVAFVQVDNSALFFTPGELGTNVYVADTSTGQVTRLSSFENRNASFPTWSPDGKFVAFVSTMIVSEETHYGEVWVASADGRQLYAVSGTVMPNNALAWLPSMSWQEGK